MSLNRIYYHNLNELAAYEPQQEIVLNVPVYEGTRDLQLSVFPPSQERRPMGVKVLDDVLVFRALDCNDFTIRRRYNTPNGEVCFKPVFAEAVGEVVLKRCEQPDDDEWQLVQQQESPKVNDTDGFVELVMVIADQAIRKVPNY